MRNNPSNVNQPPAFVRRVGDPAAAASQADVSPANDRPQNAHAQEDMARPQSEHLGQI